MKKVAIGGALVGLALIVAGAFWLAYRNSAENDIAADETPVQSPVVQSGQEAPTAKQGAQDSPTEAAENAVDTAANGDAATLVTKPRVAYTNEKGEMIGITRQGNKYVINPHRYGPVHPYIDPKAWAAAGAEPTGPPLSLPWTETFQGDQFKMNARGADWYDPRTWESYRNFFGFDPPFSGDGPLDYEAVIDNWGTPIQWHRNTAVVRRYTKTRGFRPSPAQLEQYLNLEDAWKQAHLVGETNRAAALRQEMLDLRASAQGEIPVPESFVGNYTGTVEEDSSLSGKDRQALYEAAYRDVYKRMGIEHLYDFYEKP